MPLSSNTFNKVNNVKFTTSVLQKTITRHTKVQETVTHNQEKSHSIETDSELTEMMQLADKDIKQLL